MKKAIFGYGGHAKEVARQMNCDVTFFVDDKYVSDVPNLLGISQFNPNEYEIIIAVADSVDRHRIVNSLPPETRYYTFIHPTSLIMDSNIEIGEGSFIGANSILTTNIKLGKHTILNRGNHVGHDSILGDFTSMMPASVIGGNVIVGDRVYFGSCSNVREKIKIVSDVVIGMNAAVVKNIDDSGTYVGVPAQKIKNQKLN